MFKHSKDNMHKLPHSSSNNDHFRFRFFLKIVTKSFDNWVIFLSNHTTHCHLIFRRKSFENLEFKPIIYCIKLSKELWSHMARSKIYKSIPVQMQQHEFNEFVLPYLTRGKRGSRNQITYFKIFNYILKLVHTGCQWEQLPIDKDATDKAEIHYTRVFRKFKRGERDGCFAKIFGQSVVRLFEKKCLIYQ